jgi:hypothetical protein
MPPPNSPAVTGRSDYAACSGDMPGDTNWKGPATLAAGDAMSDAAWNAQPGGANDATGVIFRRSMLLPTDIPDGASNTYLLGERYMNPAAYLNGTACNDQGWNMGYDYDTNRWAYPDEHHRPRRDTLGYTNCYAFGSAHDGVFHMAMCDGSTHAVSYDVALDVLKRSGNRKDP